MLELIESSIVWFEELINELNFEIAFAILCVKTTGCLNHLMSVTQS